MRKAVQLIDMGSRDSQLVELNPAELMPLPYPYDKPEDQLDIKRLSESQQQRLECSLDGFSALQLPRPQRREEEERLVQSFLAGVKKLFSRDDNGPFLGPLMLRLDYCAKCQTCAEACPVFIASGRQEIYRPTFRSELFRRIIKKYVMPGSRFSRAFHARRRGDLPGYNRGFVAVRQKLLLLLHDGPSKRPALPCFSCLLVAVLLWPILLPNL